MVDLSAIKSRIDEAAAKVVELKGAKAEVSVIKEAVAALLAAKKEYADNNGGIGADGKPFDDGKKKKKEKKAPVEDQTPNEENAKKKAEKKAAKAAAKKAHKEAGGKEAGGKEAADKKCGEKAASGNSEAAGKPKPKMMQMKRKINFAKVEPYQLCFSPNEGDMKPLVALGLACEINCAPDLHLKMDIHRSYPVMGMEALPASPLSKGEVVGDIAIARYIARAGGRRSDLGLAVLGGPLAENQARVDQWVDYATSLTGENPGMVAASINDHLATRNFLVGSSVTLADFAMFAACGWAKFSADSGDAINLHLEEMKPWKNAYRWTKMMAGLPSVIESCSIMAGIDGKTELFSGNMDEIARGCNHLQGGMEGQVVTRFPPEPSGYLHVGHAKAVLLNNYYARRYKGKLIVRFDDTNPSKEKDEYQKAIVEDLAKMEVYPDLVTFTSDYFEQMRDYAITMIKEGLAFMDNTPQEQMQDERMKHINSKHRNQSVEDALKYFDEMCSGSKEGGEWCLRAKIDMSSVNGTMRDPVLYRQNTTPHHRSGTKYKAYPTYDLACPIVDSIEGVTHALRTLEYNDRDEQYAWLQHALKLRRVRIHAFSRMNFMYTELSKRKLTWFVENKKVTGWDDPRFPTVRGVVRRGINIQALTEFILEMGASRRINLMEWNKFWAKNKKEIDPLSKRFMAVSGRENCARVKVVNAPAMSANAFITTEYFPKDATAGKRIVRIGTDVLVEKSDVEGIQVGEDIVLMRWGLVKVTKVDGDSIEGEYVDTESGSEQLKNAKRKLTWLADCEENVAVKLYEFDNLISKASLEEGEDYKDFINENNKAVSEAIGDSGLKRLKENDVIQLERRGFFRVDKAWAAGKGNEIELITIPDGKSKAMSTITGKLAHR